MAIICFLTLVFLRSITFYSNIKIFVWIFRKCQRILGCCNGNVVKNGRTILKCRFLFTDAINTDRSMVFLLVFLNWIINSVCDLQRNPYFKFQHSNARLAAKAHQKFRVDWTRFKYTKVLLQWLWKPFNRTVKMRMEHFFLLLDSRLPLFLSIYLFHILSFFHSLLSCVRLSIIAAEPSRVVDIQTTGNKVAFRRCV